MSNQFYYGAEPFQGFTEFDELESLDEFDELESLDEFGMGFEFAEEGETRGRRRPRPVAGRRGQPRRTARGPRRPGMRPPPRRPVRPRRPPGRPRPGSRILSPFPTLYPVSTGSCPGVGRFGNWLRNGDQLVILLDEDDAPFNVEPTGDTAPTTAPTEDTPDAPDGSSQAAPDGDATAEPPEGAQGELSGRRGRARRRLRRIQRALNSLRGLRLPPHGIADTQTRSALRAYQEQKGLMPHGQADHQTELALARDIANAEHGYEYEDGGEDSEACKRCLEAYNRCLQSNASPVMCLTWLGGCRQLNCAARTPPPAPTPQPGPTPTPTLPNCPSRPARPILSYRSTGSAVKILQSRLNAQGATPPLPVSGDFDLKTHAAVLAFQKARKLKVDGIVGPQTWGALGC